jgi:hypothetical protein
MPFDQFSIEQLAGDLLPNPTQDQLIATGFNRNHLLNGEGGAIPEEQRFNNLFDRVDTTATTWLALTMACAQCHDHKFDPVTQRDYYGLLAAFNQLSESGTAPFDPGRLRIAKPSIEVLSDENKQRLAELEAKVKTAEASGQVKEKFELALASWTAGLTPDTKLPDGKPLDGKLVEILRTEAGKRAEPQKKELEAGLRTAFEKKVWPELGKKDAGVKSAEDAKAELARYRANEVPRVMVMRDDQPRDTFILDRGEYLKPKEKIVFATPAFPPGSRERRAEEPARVCALAIPAGSPSDRARAGQPDVAALFRERPGQDERGPRRAKPDAGAQRIARLAGGGISRERLADEAYAPADRDQRHLSAEQQGVARTAAARSRESVVCARFPISSSVAHPPRCGACGERPARSENRGKAGVSLSAGRDLGDPGDHQGARLHLPSLERC